MKLTEEERRVLLDLVDEEHSRDVREHSRGRTTRGVFLNQSAAYDRLRAKIVRCELDEGFPPPPEHFG